MRQQELLLRWLRLPCLLLRILRLRGLRLRWLHLQLRGMVLHGLLGLLRRLRLRGLRQWDCCGGCGCGAAAAEAAARGAPIYLKKLLRINLVLGHENDDNCADLCERSVLPRRNACFCKTERFVSTESGLPAGGAKLLLRTSFSARA